MLLKLKPFQRAELLPQFFFGFGVIHRYHCAAGAEKLSCGHPAPCHADYQYFLLFIVHSRAPLLHCIAQTETIAIRLRIIVIPAYILTICVSEYPFFSK